MNHYTTTNLEEFRGYPINTGYDGQYFCYSKYLERILHVFQEALLDENIDRLLFVRFDVHFPAHGYSVDGRNGEIKHLMKMLSQNSENNGYGFRYVWVWEKKDEAGYHHYHCIALLDYDKVYDYKAFLRMVSCTWDHVLGGEGNKGLIDHCDRDQFGNPVENGIKIQKPSRYAQGAELVEQQQRLKDQLDRCYYWASYLAKTAQKDKSYRPPRTRGLGSSQLR